MSPEIRFPLTPVHRDPKDAGVLILLYPVDGKVTTVLIKRTDYPGVHSGQISFPGGKMEDMDSDISATSIREAEEELGIDLREMNTIGRLTELHIPVSNFTVYPLVSYLKERPVFNPDRIEVDHLIEVCIEDLMKPGIIKYTWREILSEQSRVPYFDLEGRQLWGATAMILSEFLDLISRSEKNHQE